MDKDNKKNKSSAIIGATSEVVDRYGSAVKEHFVAYGGKDNETGTELVRGLKDIAKSKINPDFKESNIKQQSGFSAEVKSTARQNAENIINKNSDRKVRSDDLGSVNDQLYDHFEIDAKGNIISGSGTQMKFVGSTPKAAFNKLKNKSFDKYFENDVPIEVPSDFYDGMKEEAQKQIDDLKAQLNSPIVKADKQKTAELKSKLNKCEKIKKSIKKSNVSNDEARLARLNPKLSTAQDIAKVSHSAGKEAATLGAAVGGSVSIIKNTVALVKGDIEADEAFKNVAIDTVSSATVSYGTGFVGSTVKGLMQNSKSGILQAASKTALPAMIVTASLELTKIMSKYINGEIDGVQCFEQMGESGVSMVSSAMFATIGQVAIPIPVLGAVIGSMVGYAVATASYGTILNAAKEKKLAHEERIAIERQCEEHIKLIQEYRQELEKQISTYLVSTAEVFQNAFDNIKLSLEVGDVDGFIKGANGITQALGKEPVFDNMEQLEAVMNDKETIKI